MRALGLPSLEEASGGLRGPEVACFRQRHLLGIARPCSQLPTPLTLAQHTPLDRPHLTAEGSEMGGGGAGGDPGWVTQRAKGGDSCGSSQPPLSAPGAQRALPAGDLPPG